MNDEFEGLLDLTNQLEEYIAKSDSFRVEKALLIGGEALANDVKKLPKPLSKIRTAGYTHLLHTVSAWKTNRKDVAVGWGKYYGPMIEQGTDRMKARPHLEPTWNKNKTKYQSLMIKSLGF